ncbi:aldolase catalytic domain-containing protein [Pseudobutyrivibrio xylanivorans]|uniref:Pyruvate carboxyltransferase n=1 Tax=Pseudobutyrivibrio xylanivorans TaxID=185007 RepID=A0A5P6VRX3_PSEXY|nr:aldolase catalytic domain-containing protein [Pseudobutyrivibrio xylanivorans]QFJ53964.1 pyruvate carboxyltransferase [Pseudobutyrivibrio xylanivorans]
MNRIKVLDVTLRDGGCVNDFNFGTDYMEKILAAQEAANIDIIEMGYIDDKDGSENGRTKFINDTFIKEAILKSKKPGLQYVAMIDYGKFDVNNLAPRGEDTIDGIRMAFHKKDRFNMLEKARIIMSKGYDFYIQPMITMRYSDAELLELIETVNKEIPNAKGFYIVDSFGEMRPNDMERMLNLVDYNLDRNMMLGFHSHNNLQLSYSNAISMLQFPTTRTIMVDSSIMGMGKGAGNLNTELLLEHLNLFYGGEYVIQPLLDVIDKVINQLHDEFYWGYAPEYYLSSANHCTPSYASYYFNKHMLPIDQVSELLNMLAEEKKISFDKAYAEQVYIEYNKSKTVDDTQAVEDIKNQIGGKKVLLVAPGRSIKDAADKIKELVADDDVFSIGLNSNIDIAFDYLLTTRTEAYSAAVAGNKNVIVPSNISKGGRGNVKVLDYSKWINVDEQARDSATVISLNLLKNCEVKEILLAGFDGFSVDINENYFDASMRHPYNAEEAQKRNQYHKELFGKVKEEGVKLTFITPSKYE